jgi:drug/metabolite transporter (DMT)-like permease
MESETYIIVKEDNQTASSQMMSWFLFLFVCAWLLAGALAFLWSIVCFGKSGTMPQHVVGLLLAILFGPFYWLYYFSVKKYCR